MRRALATASLTLVMSGGIDRPAMSPHAHGESVTPAHRTAPAQSRSRSRNGQRSPRPSSKSQTRAPDPRTIRERPLMQCPSILGNGVSTQQLYCDVLAGTEPASGLRITIPPHTGDVTLRFTLHNRQTYSESEAREGRAFARYTASVRVLSPSGEPIGRALIQSEFRAARDLVERIGGGAGPGGVKAVAPTGVEQIVTTLPANLSEVSIVGERLLIERKDGSETVTAPGRPVAVISAVEIEYRPGKKGR
jgi:hypothetical protein